MANLSNIRYLVRDMTAMLDQPALLKGMAESAARAQRTVTFEIAQMQRQCGLFGSGATSSYDGVSRRAHIAAFELMTYAEVCASVGARPQVECEQLMDAGKAIQSRVLAHEDLYLADALSPSDVFYDDLLPTLQMDSEHLPARFVKTAPGHSALNLSDMPALISSWVDQPAMAG